VNTVRGYCWGLKTEDLNFRSLSVYKVRSSFGDFGQSCFLRSAEYSSALQAVSFIRGFLRVRSWWYANTVETDQARQDDKDQSKNCCGNDKRKCHKNSSVKQPRPHVGENRSQYNDEIESDEK